MCRKWFLFVIAAWLVIGSKAVAYEASPNEWPDQNDYRIVRALPPTIDGVISPGEWDAAEWIVIDEPKPYTLVPTPNDISDIHWANMWSPVTNLIYCVVYGTDTDHNLKTNMVDWNTQDDLEIFVDANENNALSYENDFSIAQHYFLGSNGMGGAWITLLGQNATEHTPGGYAATVVGDVITYEFALTPYASLDMANVANSTIRTLKAGDYVGLDLNFASCDDDKNSNQMAEHSWPYQMWKNATHMLDLELVNTLDPNRASVPDPLSLSVLVSPNKTLWWMPGDYADDHDIFFGEDYNDVLDATVSLHPNVFYVRQDSNSIDRTVYNAAGELVLGKKYYWRVDEISATVYPYEWTGNVWEFTVDSGQAKYPEPVDKAKDLVWGDILLSWTKGLKSVSSDVYFGDDYDAVNDAGTSDPEFKGNRLTD
ncbi:MAG TPA: sugar-binding protein, partial [Sedimentisphaerales bacterium]|nr:sugar-binding protein [Sedimentisphaerales bacterium]